MNLDPYAASCIEVAIEEARREFDLDAIRDAAREEVAQQAENACIYYSECMDIISRYERDHDGSDYMTDATFTADKWQEAMVAYANAVACDAIGSKVEALLTALEKAADDLESAATDWGCDDTSEPRITTECPHGWAAHDKEDEAGTHFWSEPNLEGCRAVAIRAAGFWLSHTWTPEPAEAEDDSDTDTTEAEG